MQLCHREVDDGGYGQNKATLFGAFVMKDARCAVRVISNQTDQNSKHIPGTSGLFETVNVCCPRRDIIGVCEYDTPLPYLIVYLGAV
jgi:hypothetical protein